MSQNQWKKTLPDSETQKTADQAPAYRYRWSYEEQKSFDQSLKQKKKKSGALVYALVMIAVFLFCFGLLIGSLIWYRADGNGQDTKPNQNATGTAFGSNVVRDVAEAVNPCTVLIYAQGTSYYSYGTGFFIAKDGYIATNYHVVEGANVYTVTLYSGDKLDAELVGYKAEVDLAVLKIKGSGYPVLPVGDSDSLHVGDLAIAVGNPAGEEGAWSTTVGFISALDRKVTVDGTSSAVELSMIQTDAALNPGNSGGPLCNAAGEVIGVISRKMTDAEGISYALPINGSMQVLNSIMKKGNADDVNPSFSKERPLIGISCATVAKGYSYTYRGEQRRAECDGVFVSEVNANGSAYGILQVCDIITAIDGNKVTSVEALTDKLYEYEAGDQVTFTVCRDGEQMTLSVTLGGS